VNVGTGNTYATQTGAFLSVLGSSTWEFYLYPVSSAVPAFGQQSIFEVTNSSTGAGGNPIGSFTISPTVTNSFTVYLGQGASHTTSTTLSLSTWHKIDADENYGASGNLLVDGINVGSSYTGGTPTGGGKFLQLGFRTGGSTAYASEYWLGTITETGQGNGVSSNSLTAFLNPSSAGQADNTSVTSALLATATVAGMGTWQHATGVECTSANMPNWYFESAGAIGGVSSVTAYGVSYPATSNSGLQFLFNSVPPGGASACYFLYPSTLSPVASFAFWLNTTETQGFSFNEIQTPTNGDFLVVNMGHDRFHLENAADVGALSFNNPTGVPYVSDGTKYFISEQFRKWVPWAVGGSFMQQTSGGSACSLNETMIQNTSNSQGTLTDQSDYGIIVKATNANTPTLGDTWVGQTSSCNAVPAWVLLGGGVIAGSNFTIGENVRQNVTLATCTDLLEKVPNSNTHLLFQACTGSPDTTNPWVGLSSGTTISVNGVNPKVPIQFGARPYHVMDIYHADCSHYATLKSLVSATSPQLPNQSVISPADVAAVDTGHYVSTDRLRENHVTGAQFPCQ